MLSEQILNIHLILFIEILRYLHSIALIRMLTQMVRREFQHIHFLI